MISTRKGNLDDFEEESDMEHVKPKMSLDEGEKDYVMTFRDLAV